jgi:hypothetical protein
MNRSRTDADDPLFSFAPGAAIDMRQAVGDPIMMDAVGGADGRTLKRVGTPQMERRAG